jgi:hypothetical protein
VAVFGSEMYSGKLIQLDTVDTFLEEKPNYINFHKMRVQAKILRQLDKFRSAKYHFKPIPEYIFYLTEQIPTSSENQMRANSLKCEPVDHLE